MSNVQAKKLNLALHLNPATSESDRVAMDVLQKWYEKCKQSQDVDMDAVVRVFLHDVYLAGLHLHRINPRLCRHVAEAMEEKPMTIAELVKQLRACGVWPDGEPDENAPQSEFSDAQLRQLQQLTVAASGSPVERTPGAADESVMQQRLAEQSAQLTAVLDELQQLRALAEQQASLLKQLQGRSSAARESTRASQAEELSVADMAPQLAGMQKIRQKGVF